MGATAGGDAAETGGRVAASRAAGDEGKSETESEPKWACDPTMG